MVVIATPGQDMILIMSRALTHGTRALSGGFQSWPRAHVWLYRGSGLVMVGLALRLALARRGDA